MFAVAETQSNTSQVFLATLRNINWIEIDQQKHLRSNPFSLKEYVFFSSGSNLFLTLNAMDFFWESLIRSSVMSVTWKVAVQPSIFCICLIFLSIISTMKFDDWCSKKKLELEHNYLAFLCLLDLVYNRQIASDFIKTI